MTKRTITFIYINIGTIITLLMMITIYDHWHQDEDNHHRNEDVEHIIEDHDDVDLWVKTTWQGTRPGTGGKASLEKYLYNQ